MRILVTGVNGFVGEALARGLLNIGTYKIRGLGRSADSSVIKDYLTVDLSTCHNWAPILSNVDVVVHCAARVHIMQDTSEDPLSLFRYVNTRATLEMARGAADAGVKRFVFLSSVKVNGERTQRDHPFNENYDPAPEDPYAISKLEAEQGLFSIARSTGMEVVIIRPPLVYGPRVKGNLLGLMKLARTGIPLPLGAIHNQRSMVYLDNLVSFILQCIEHPAAANEVFLISDNRDVSTSELILLIRQEMGLPTRLLPFPSGVLELFARMIGKGAVAERLCGNLQIDSEKARRLLNWVPPSSVEQGISNMVLDYMTRQISRQ